MKNKRICIFLVLILVLSAAAFAFADNDRGVTFLASVEPEYINASDQDQQVVVTIDANQPVLVDGYCMDILFPEGWSITAISNKELEMTDDDYVLKLKSGNVARILWQEPDCNSVYTTNLAVVTYNVPGGTPAGRYTLKAFAFELTDTGGNIWEDDASVSFDIVIKTADGEDSGETVVVPGGDYGPGGFPGDSQSSSETPEGGNGSAEPSGNDSGNPSGTSTENEGSKTEPGKTGQDENPSQGTAVPREKSNLTVILAIGGILLLSFIIFILLGRKKKKGKKND